MTRKVTPEKTANGVCGAIVTSALNPVNSLRVASALTVNNTSCQGTILVFERTNPSVTGPALTVARLDNKSAVKTCRR